MSRKHAIESARAILDTSHLVIDTETTGLGDDAEIVEIAVVDATGKTILDTFIRPTCPIPAQATAIHGITDSMVMAAPLFIEAWPLLYAIMRDKVILTYNAPYDRRLIEQSLMMHGLTRPQVRAQIAGSHTYQDIMTVFAEYYGEFNNNNGGYKWKSLDFAAGYCKLQDWSKHRALGDAQTARAVLLHMAVGEGEEA